jgi:hypothetical protein
MQPHTIDANRQVHSIAGPVIHSRNIRPNCEQRSFRGTPTLQAHGRSRVLIFVAAYQDELNMQAASLQTWTVCWGRNIPGRNEAFVAYRMMPVACFMNICEYASKHKYNGTPQIERRANTSTTCARRDTVLTAPTYRRSSAKFPLSRQQNRTYPHHKRASGTTTHAHVTRK